MVNQYYSILPIVAMIVNQRKYPFLYKHVIFIYFSHRVTKARKKRKTNHRKSAAAMMSYSKNGK